MIIKFIIKVIKWIGIVLLGIIFGGSLFLTLLILAIMIINKILAM